MTKFEAWNKLIRMSALFGTLILLLCAVVTVVDVFLRNFFANGVPGIIDLTQLAVIWGAFLTIPLGFAQSSHISIDAMVLNLNHRSRALLKVLALVLAAGAMAACFWWGWKEAAKQIGYGDRSMTIGIPVFWYWLPLVYGCLLSTFASIAVLISTVHGLFDRNSLTRG